MDNEAKERAAKCLEAAKESSSRGDVQCALERLRLAPAQKCKQLKDAMEEMRHALVCATRADAQTVADAVDLALAEAHAGETVYHVIVRPGWYTDMQWIKPHRTYWDRAAAVGCAKRQGKKFAVIESDMEIQSPPWQGCDLNVMHRQQAIY